MTFVNRIHLNLDNAEAASDVKASRKPDLKKTNKDAGEINTAPQNSDVLRQQMDEESLLAENATFTPMQAPQGQQQGNQQIQGPQNQQGNQQAQGFQGQQQGNQQMQGPQNQQQGNQQMQAPQNQQQGSSNSDSVDYRKYAPEEALQRYMQDNNCDMETAQAALEKMYGKPDGVSNKPTNQTNSFTPQTNQTNNFTPITNQSEFVPTGNQDADLKMYMELFNVSEEEAIAALQELMQKLSQQQQ